MRWSGLIGLLVGCVCFAGPTKQKGLGSPREDEPEAPRSSSALGQPDDLGLLRALLYALEPAPTEIRVIAIEDLGLLGDTRALNPLAQLLMDPNPAVQSAALRSIGAMRHPRAEEILSNVARHPTLPERLKLTAVDLVLFQNTASAIGFLKQLSRSSTYTFNIQNAAKRVLTDVPPARIEASK